MNYYSVTISFPTLLIIKIVITSLTKIFGLSIYINIFSRMQMWNFIVKIHVVQEEQCKLRKNESEILENGS